MATDYCSLSEVQAAMPDSSFATSHDPILTALITRASRLFDKQVKRWPGYFAAGTDETRYFDGAPHGIEQLIDELAAAPTSVAVTQTGVIDNAAGIGGEYVPYSTSDYLLWPYNAPQVGRPYQKLVLDIQNGSQASWYGFRKGVKIVGKFGYSTPANTPDEIRQAVIIQVVRWFKRGQQAFQDVGAIVDLGQLKYVQRLDPDLAEVLDHYKEVII